ncbi:TPA: DUF4236 domain-containing protein [Providencia alcalifaciens]
MALRFRKTIKIAGVKVNIGKNGVSSISVGKKGASLNIGKNGIYSNLGLPGTGLSYRTKLADPSKKQSSNHQLTKSEQQQINFDYFIHKSKVDVQLMKLCFLSINGVDIYSDDFVIDNASIDDELLDKFNALELSFNRAVSEVEFSGDTGQRAKNKISKFVFEIKGWLDSNYPSWESEKYQIEKILEKNISNQREKEKAELKTFKEKQFYKTKFTFLFILTFFLPLIFCWFSLQKKYPMWFKVMSFSWALILTLIVLNKEK